MIIKRKLYSFLSYRLFAKKDYDKFSRKGQEILTGSRNSLAEDTAKLLGRNKRDLQERIKHALANDTSGRSKKEIIAHETEIYNANNKQLLQQLKDKKLKAEVDAELKSRKIWGQDSGKAVGDERKRIKDQARKIMDKAYDGRDSKGIRLDLKNRFEAYKQQKAVQPTNSNNLPVLTNSASTSSSLNNLPVPTNSTSTRTRRNIKRRGSIFNNSLNPTKWPRNTKIGAGVGTGLVLAGTGAYLYNKSKKKD